MQTIHPKRVKNEKNSPVNGIKCKEFTLEKKKLQRI